MNHRHRFYSLLLLLLFCLFSKHKGHWSSWCKKMEKKFNRVTRNSDKIFRLTTSFNHCSCRFFCSLWFHSVWEYLYERTMIIVHQMCSSTDEYDWKVSLFTSTFNTCIHTHTHINLSKRETIGATFLLRSFTFFNHNEEIVHTKHGHRKISDLFKRKKRRKLDTFMWKSDEYFDDCARLLTSTRHTTISIHKAACQLGISKWWIIASLPRKRERAQQVIVDNIECIQ